jgi:Fic family protein
VYAESDENDATYFVLHQCRTILQAIDELHAYIASKADDARRSRELLRNNQALKLGLNHRQLALIRHAVDHPGMTYTIKGHRRYHNVSYQTARTDLLAVAESSLLVQSKIGRELVFVAPDDLRARLEGCGDRA